MEINGRELGKSRSKKEPGRRKDNGNKRIIAETEGCIESELTDSDSTLGKENVQKRREINNVLLH